MARGNFGQTSFLGGEWSPFSQGKSDQQDYYTGMNLCLNYIPTDEGVISRRSGSRLSAHAKVHTGLIKLITFVSESADALVCEFTDSLVRFHSRGTLLTEPDVIVTGITAATPAVVTTLDPHGYSNGDTVVFTTPDTLFPLPLRNKQYVVGSVTSLTFDLTDTLPEGTTSTDGTELNALVALAQINVAKVIERTTGIPYTAAQLSDLKHTEEEDTLYVFHPAHEPVTIERLDVVVGELEFIDGPYLDINEETTTLAFSALTGSITVTASATTGINGGQGFLAGDIGRLIRVNTGTTIAPAWSWLTITAVATTISITATVSGLDLAVGTATTLWRLGVYSDTTGWPTHGVIHEQRLFLVSGAKGGRIDGSRTFRFGDFTPTDVDGTVADDNGVSAIFGGSGRQNAKWLLSLSNGMLTGADGGEYVVRASSFDDPISPFSIQVRRHTAYGSSDILPARAGKIALFVQELGRSLYEYKDTGSGSYDGNDISRQARHLTTDGLIEIEYQKIPNPVLWGLRGDGRIIGCTYRDDLEGRQVAWHRQSVEYDVDVTAGEDADDRYLRGGNSDSTGNTHSISIAPFSDPGATRNDNLWIAITRGTTTCIEYLTPIFDTSFRQNEGVFVDGANVYFKDDENLTWEVVSDDDTNAVVRFFGFERLEGKTVDGQFRGLALTPAVVGSGQVDFTIASGLLTAAASFQTVSQQQVSTANLTLSSAFISEFHLATPNTVGAGSAQSTIITGEDGVRYYVAGGITGVGGSGSTVFINDADTGLAAFNIPEATLLSDANAAGITPDGGGIGTTVGSVAAFTIPETSYFVVIFGTASGASSDKRILYYRIDDAGDPILDGGYAGKTGGLAGAQFSPASSGGAAYVAAGHVMQRGFSGTTNTVAFSYPVCVAYFGEGVSKLFVVPSINYILGSTPVIDTITDHWVLREISLSSFYGSNVFALGDSPLGNGPNQNRGFFLPQENGQGSLFCQMFYLSDLEAHDANTESPTNTFLAANASTFVTGLISSLRVNALGIVPPGSPAITFDVLAYRQSARDLTIAKHTDFDVFPFPDEKEDFAGNAGSADDNYYSNPSIFPSNPDDPNQPWFLFFGRMYREAGDTEKIGVRIYEWNPITEKARFLSFAKGQVYTLTTDVDANTTPTSISVHWDRTTTDVTCLIRSDATGEDSFVYVKFGTFAPEFETVLVTDSRQVEAVVGCGYNSRAQLLRPDFGAGAQNGAGLGKLRRVDQYSMLTYKAGDIDIGTDFDTLFPVVFENPAGVDAFGRNPLFSQVAHGSLESGYDFDNLMLWEQSEPLPGTIVAVAGFSNTSDR